MLKVSFSQVTRVAAPTRRMGGFSLLEVLISVIVIAIGLLGLAGLQTIGIRNTHNAFLRGQMTQLMYDLSDSIRTNRDGGIAGDYVRTSVTTVPTAPAYDCSTTFPTATKVCSRQQLADADIKSWLERLNRIIPSGRWQVDVECVNCANGMPYILRVQWDEMDSRDPTAVSGVDRKVFQLGFIP